MNQGFIGASWHSKPPDRTCKHPPKTYFGRFLKGFLLLLWYKNTIPPKQLTCFTLSFLLMARKKISTSSAILADSPNFLPIESFDLFTKTHQLCFKKHPCSCMMLQLVGPPKTGTSHSNRTRNCPVRGATWSEHSRSSKRSSTIFSAWWKKNPESERLFVLI